MTIEQVVKNLELVEKYERLYFDTKSYYYNKERGILSISDNDIPPPLDSIKNDSTVVYPHSRTTSKGSAKSFGSQISGVESTYIEQQ